MRILIATLLAFLAAAAPAAAQTVTGASAAYDTGAGGVRVTANVAGSPDEDAALVALVGTTWADGACAEMDAVLLTGPAAPGGRPPASFEQYLPGLTLTAASGPAVRTGDDRTVTLAATDARLAGRPYSCALVTLALDDGPVRVSQVQVPVAVTGTPPGGGGGGGGAAPGGSGAGAGTGVLGTPPGTTRPRARLALRLRGVPKRVRPGRTYAARLVVRNTGTARSAPARVSLRRVRGVTLRPRSPRVKALAPGRSQTLKLRVRVTRKVRRSTRLAVVVKGRDGTKTVRRTVRRR